MLTRPFFSRPRQDQNLNFQDQDQDQDLNLQDHDQDQDHDITVQHLDKSISRLFFSQAQLLLNMRIYFNHINMVVH